MNVLESIAVFTENRITKRRQKKIDKKNAKKTFLGELKDWISAFLFAIIVVSLFNMWGCQQYIVPTGSMETTIMGGDRLFVNKRAYGTELYSYGPKRGDKTPERGDVITFYNPEYESSSAFVESARDLLFLGTFTLVNLNKDKSGNPLEKMFIKRAIGLPGDRVRFINGNVYIRRFGSTKYVKEDLLSSSKVYTPYRIIENDEYNSIRLYAEAFEYDAKKKAIPSYIESRLYLNGMPKNLDYFEAEKFLNRVDLYFSPNNTEYIENEGTSFYGSYVKENHILPLGDNRDGSHDGRFFGPVSNSKINGRAMFIVFPFKRMKAL